MTYNYAGYYNPYFPQGIPQQPQPQPQPQPQQQINNVSVFPAVYVSSKNEVESIRPDQNNNPMYFHNRANKEIYLKQYDSTGAAPILTFKLVEDVETEPSKTETGLNLLNNKIDKLIKLVEKEEPEEKRSKK